MKILSSAAAVGLCVSLVACQEAPVVEETVEVEAPAVAEAPSKADKIAANKALTKELIEVAFVQVDPEASRKLITDEYIQHNPFVGDGADAFIAFLPALKAGNIKLSNHGLIADEEYVVAHNLAENAQIIGFDAVVTFDVWRVEDGLLAEHWDNLAEQTPPNPSGRTQLDGNKTITDLEKTDENKALVLDFVETVLIGEQTEKAADYVAADVMQHNSELGDGLDTWMTGLATMASEGRGMDYDELHLSVAEGNMVFTMSEGSLGGKHAALYNMFRVDDGKIVEAWDIVELIPEEWAHDNGKF